MIAATVVAYLLATAAPEPPSPVLQLPALTHLAEALQVPNDFDGFTLHVPKVPSVLRLTLEIGVPAAADWVSTEIAIRRFGLSEANPLMAGGPTLRAVATVAYTAGSVIVVRWLYGIGRVVEARIARGIAIGLKVLYVVLNARTIARADGR